MDIWSVHLELEPKLFLLGFYPKDTGIDSDGKVFFNQGILKAKRVITMFWKRMETPSIVKWFQEMSLCFPLEKITYTLMDKHVIFNKIWE